MLIALTRRLKALAASRPPDFVVGGSREAPYMRRWWVIPRNRFFNIYLHHFLHSDDDRALHDHPWWNVSVLLEGSYIEHTILAGGTVVRTRYDAGQWKFRRAKAAHRVELLPHPVLAAKDTFIPLECWSLFVTGPVIRTWGFHCPKQWVPWHDFVDQRDTGKVGRGCGEHDAKA